MPEPEWIEYNGKKILLESYYTEDIEEILDTIQRVTYMIIDEESKDILVLTDLTGLPEVPALADSFKKAAKEQKPFIKKNAIIGLTPLKKIFLNGVRHFTGSPIKGFESREEAMEWLVE